MAGTEGTLMYYVVDGVVYATLKEALDAKLGK
jgi:hypothetical protein